LLRKRYRNLCLRLHFQQTDQVDQDKQVRPGTDPAAANLKNTLELSRTDHRSGYFWLIHQGKQVRPGTDPAAANLKNTLELSRTDH
jgi:hypothetical protein